MPQYIVKRLPAQKALQETVMFQGEDKNGKETWVHTQKKAKVFPNNPYKPYDSRYKYEYVKVSD